MRCCNRCCEFPTQDAIDIRIKRFWRYPDSNAARRLEVLILPADTPVSTSDFAR